MTYELIDKYALYTPLLTLIFFIHLKIKYLKELQIFKYLFIKTLSIGLLSFFVGALLGAEIYCIDAKYAECALGGLFVSGPISFTIISIIYLLIQIKRKSSS